MPRRAAVVALVLAVLALLGAGKPAWAHRSPLQPHAERAIAPQDDAAASEVPAPAREALAPAADPPRLPWLAMVGVSLALLATARRRRAVAVAVILVLAVFAFEDGVHSVHHGLDPGTAAKAADCQVAAAAQHLTATTVDPTPPIEAIPIAALAEDGDSSELDARFLPPDQGRAPPLPTA